ncbi:MAG TPA: amidohydrolase [bacterium]|nr:amidohydrolase [bacterium]
MDKPDLSNEVKSLLPELIRLRRDFHRHPEPAFQEERTAAVVAAYLRDLGLPVQSGIAQTGVVGLIEGKKPGRTLLLRADMDALPVEEANEIDYRSEVPGRMHACGHDGHTAILLGVARVLAEKKDRLVGNVKLMFQPAEEKPGGALPMIQEGILENPKVDAALALHLAMMLPTGQIGVRPGPVFASTDEFRIVVLGKGGHGGMPHETVDPIACAARVVEALQTLVSRECHPTKALVLTIGCITGGQTFNVVPDRVELGGTVRTYDAALRQSMEERIRRVVKGTTEAAGADYQLDYRYLYPPLLNDLAMVALVESIAHNVVGEQHTLVHDLDMIGEDMAFIMERVPGCYFFVGARNEEKGCIHPLHSSRFNFDEDAMPIAVEILIRCVERFLND